MFAFVSFLSYASVTCPRLFFSNCIVHQPEKKKAITEIFFQSREILNFYLPSRNGKLFSFEIVLRGRMVLCKIHALAIYTIALLLSLFLEDAAVAFVGRFTKCL